MPEQKRTVYLGGPMRGYPRHNFDAFELAALHLEENGGFRVLAPHRKDLQSGFDPDREVDEQGFDLKKAMRWDTAAVLRSSTVFMLYGWRNSRGALAEVALAHAVDIPVWEQMEPDDYRWLSVPVNTVEAQDRELPMLEAPAPEPITVEAQRLVYGDRNASYGPPTEDFTRTGKIWGAILESWRRSDEEAVPPVLVGLCMVGVKVSREVHQPKRDNRVDMVGYAVCVDRIREAEQGLPAARDGHAA